MTTHFWYSQASQETGKWLAAQLKIEAHGVLPPKDFNGTLICWGASPADKFKWETRTLRAVFNDPRKIRTYLDRKVLFDKLAEAGVNVTSCLSLTDESQYLNICNLMGVTAEGGFITARNGGSKARKVTNQAELTEAIASGNLRAFEPKFAQKARTRLYVVNGTVVGAAACAEATANDTFFARAGEELGIELKDADIPADIVVAVLRKAVETSVVKPAKGYWAPFGAVALPMRTAATLAAKVLEMDFCAVDIVINAGAVEVVNVVTTPNLLDVPSVQAAIVGAIDTWNTENSRTAKEILQGLVDDATDDEAVVLIEKLREFQDQPAVVAAQ